MNMHLPEGETTEVPLGHEPLMAIRRAGRRQTFVESESISSFNSRYVGWAASRGPHKERYTRTRLGF